LTLQAWALFCLTETLLCLNPGPSALLVISLALAQGQAAGVIAATGVIAANAVYFGLTATGLTAVHALSPQAFGAIKTLGALYLVYLGARMLARSLRAPAPTPDADADTEPPGLSRRRSFAQGFAVQLANPNLLVYFGAILPQFVDPRAAVAPQVGILAASSFAIEFGVLSAYAALSHHAGRRATPGFQRWLLRAAALLLFAAAAGLARLERG
jgi:threonine/homoserine/homoserine lactone efflux protein